MHNLQINNNLPNNTGSPNFANNIGNGNFITDTNINTSANSTINSAIPDTNAHMPVANLPVFGGISTVATFPNNPFGFQTSNSNAVDVNSNAVDVINNSNLDGSGNGSGNGSGSNSASTGTLSYTPVGSV